MFNILGQHNDSSVSQFNGRLFILRKRVSYDDLVVYSTFLVASMLAGEGKDVHGISLVG